MQYRVLSKQGAGNAMACHRTQYDRHDIRILACVEITKNIKMERNQEKQIESTKKKKASPPPPEGDVGDNNTK